MSRHPSWLLSQLPVGMVQEDFFRRFVSLFQDVAGESLDGIDNLVNVPDPSVAPAPVLPWLGSWIGTPAIDSSLPEVLQRDLVRTGSSSLAWRGTRRGLEPFLELVSGGPVTLREGGGIWREGEAPADGAWVEISLASTGWLSDDDLVALVREEVPVDVVLTLRVGDRVLAEPPRDPRLDDGSVFMDWPLEAERSEEDPTVPRDPSWLGSRPVFDDTVERLDEPTWLRTRPVFDDDPDSSEEGPT